MSSFANLLRGLWRPLRSLFRNSPWWLRIVLVLVPLLALLALFDPVIGLFGVVLDFVHRVVEPLLTTAGGRLLLLNIGLGVGVALLWQPIRRRIRELRADAALAEHLRGVDALLTGSGDPQRWFERSLRLRSVPGGPADRYPERHDDARLKLARLALERGDSDAALGQLARVRESELGPELERSLAQLRADAYLAQDALLPESVDAELDRMLVRFPDDAALLARKRRVVAARGDLVGAARLQQRVAGNAAPVDRSAALDALAEDFLRAARAALHNGDPESARELAARAREAGRVPAGVAVVLGDVRMRLGDVRGALREWGMQPSVESLQRVVDWLRDGASEPGIRDVLELSPNEGTLLALAQRYSDAGQSRRVRRVLERAARKLAPTPTVVRTTAAAWRALGEDSEAIETEDRFARSELERR